MSKFAFGLILLSAALFHLYTVFRITRLNNSKSKLSSAEVDKQVKKLDLTSRRVQVIACAAVLVLLAKGYFYG
jgi:hypothetical protein